MLWNLALMPFRRRDDKTLLVEMNDFLLRLIVLKRLKSSQVSRLMLKISWIFFLLSSLVSPLPLNLN